MVAFNIGEPVQDSGIVQAGSMSWLFVTLDGTKPPLMKEVSPVLFPP